LLKNFTLSPGMMADSINPAQSGNYAEQERRDVG
jgi:hypothetical protein